MYYCPPSTLSNLTEAERLRVLVTYTSALRQEYGRTPEVRAAEKVIDELRARVFRSERMARVCREFENMTHAGQEFIGPEAA